MKFFQFSIRNWRVVLLLLAFLPVITGMLAMFTMPKELNPDISIPLVLVIVPYPGSPPNQVESLITNKLEDKLKGLKDVDFINSTSSQGSASIAVNFDVGMDIDEKLRDVREAVADVEGELPDDIIDPLILELNFSDLPMLVVSLNGENYLDLTKTAKQMQSDIENIKDVLSCDIVGGVEREFQVEINPAQLQKYNLTLNAVLGLVASENLEIPGGTMELGGTKYITQVKGKVNDIYGLGDLAIGGLDSRTIRLRDIARIIDGEKDAESYARMNGEPAITLAVKKRQGTNTIAITDDVVSYLEGAREWLPGGTEYAITGDQAKWIRDSLSQLGRSGFQGLILVILTLYIFLGFRNSMIAAAVLPLTILIAFSFMWLTDISMNSITLFSLVLVIGMIVDNAIVVVENIFRHHGLWKRRFNAALATNRGTTWDELQKHGEVLDQVPDEQLFSVDRSLIPRASVRQFAAAAGAKEVAMPILTSTLTTIFAFMPMLIMPGTMGDFLKYIPLTVSMALAASFFVAIIVNPTISSKVMRSPITLVAKNKKKNFGARLTIWFQKSYEPILRYALRHRALFLLTVIPYVIGAIMLMATGIVEIELFPPEDIGQIFINVETPVGSPLSVTDRISAKVEQRLLADKYKPYIRNFVANIGGGGATTYDFQSGTSENYAQIIVDLVDDEDRDLTSEQIQNLLREEVRDIAGAEIKLPPVQGGPPSDAPVGIKIIGSDYATLELIAEEVKEMLIGIEGTMDVQDDLNEGHPEISFTVNREQAARLGVSTAEIVTTVRTAINGTEATTVRLDDEDVEVVVRLAETWRNSINDLENITVANRFGQLVILKEVVGLTIDHGMAAIRHYEGDRVVRVTASNQPGYSAVEITRQLQRKLNEFNLPSGYSFNYSGDFEQFQESFVALGKAFIIAVILIYVLMVAQFQSFSQPLTIMLTIPFGIFGAIYGLLIGNQEFALVALIAIVGLSGVVVNISIILIDYINKLMDQGLVLTEAIVQAALVRIRPILLTTVTTIIGLLPLTYAEEGWQPMGFSFIFGLGFAMPLTLIIIPIVHSLFEGKRRQRRPSEFK